MLRLFIKNHRISSKIIKLIKFKEKNFTTNTIMHFIWNFVLERFHQKLHHQKCNKFHSINDQDYLILLTYQI